MEFLGHIMEAGLIRTNPREDTPVLALSRLRERTELPRFLELAGFIEDDIRIAVPHSVLTSTLCWCGWAP